MKHYTSIEQSKRLIELGLGFNTADMSYPRELYLGESEYPVVIADDFKVDWTKALPCWSLAALLELVPKNKEFDICLSFGGYKGDEYIDEWFCTFEKETGDYIFEVKCGDSPIDAVFDMVCWLLENKYI